jgi:hypothetical protein
MPGLTPSYERAASLLMALYSSTNPEVFRMRKSALGSNADADLLSCTLAEEAGRASRGRASRGRASRWPNNAAGRRQASRREARALAQGVPNAREENVREEAAEEVVAGAEGAQEGREELPQCEEEAAEEAANDVQDSGDMKEAGDMDEEEQEAQEDDGAHAQRSAHLYKLRKTLLRKQRHVLNKKPPQGWPQALRKRRRIDVGRGRRTRRPQRFRLLER